MRYKIPSSISFKEFVAIMAALISLTALSVDMMLPALHQIATDLGNTNKNDAQFIISFIFIGMTIGQLFYGPISDAKGRRTGIIVSMIIFMIGSFVSIIATNFNAMLFGRFLQGLGSAGPKILVLAIVRDSYEGRDMAQVMSFIMSVFILVPAIAPSLGELILQFASWDAIFLVLMFICFLTLSWFVLRQKETLNIENRRELNFSLLKIAIKEVVTTPLSLGYTVVMGIIFGGFLGFLSTSQQILQIQYKLGEKFSLYFSVLALCLGAASIVNSKLVKKYGMRNLSKKATLLLSGFSFIFFIPTLYFSGNPPLITYMLYCMIIFFCVGVMFGNLTSIAMEPLGHIAGVAASVIGSLSTLISIPIGVTIGQFYNGKVYPIILGFCFLGFISYIIMEYTDFYSSSHNKNTLTP